MLRTNLWTITMQNVSGIKKWNYEKLPLNFAMQFPFPFPVIPGNNNVSFPFPKCGNGISIPVPKNWEWNFPVPVPKSWEWNFSFPFPFPKFGNGLSHSRSRSQMTKSHSRSPLGGGALTHSSSNIQSNLNHYIPFANRFARRTLRRIASWRSSKRLIMKQ